MADGIQHEDRPDEETISLPLSASNASALAIFLQLYIEEHKDIEIPKDIPDYEETQEMHEILLNEALFMHKEVLEVCQYFIRTGEEKEKPKIILKPNWNDGTSL